MRTATALAEPSLGLDVRMSLLRACVEKVSKKRSMIFISLYNCASTCLGYFSPLRWLIIGTALDFSAASLALLPS